MKKLLSFLTAAFLTAAVLAGCSAPADTGSEPSEEPSGTTTETTEPATSSTEETGEEKDFEYEGDASSYYIDEVYAEQIARYYAPLTEQWSEGMYFENELSALPYYYYEGDPLENVGFGFVDLDRDGHWELVIGAILGAELDPAVFEIWTLVDGEPVMLAQGGSRNRYILEYVEEDDMWYVVNEASNSAANHATYYMILLGDRFEVVQGIVCDAMANEEEPWFMAYDLDWDTSNDTPIDEETAEAILANNRSHYTALEYFPYIYYTP